MKSTKKNIKTSIKIIESAVCYEMKLTEWELQLRNRQREYVLARQLIYYLHQCEYNVVDCKTQEQIAARYNQNHATVVHGYKAIQKDLEIIGSSLVNAETYAIIKRVRGLIRVFTDNAVIKGESEYTKKMRRAYQPLRELMEKYGMFFSVTQLNEIIFASDQVNMNIKDTMNENAKH